MSKNYEVQSMNISAVTTETESNDAMFDADYWASFSEDNVSPESPETKEASEQRREAIAKMYPKFEHRRIKLDRIIPAKAEWNFFPSQNKTILDELMKNIVVYGQLSPVIVWQQDDDTYMLLGGHTRFTAIKNLYQVFSAAGDMEQATRFSTIECNVYAHDELDDIEARKIIIYDNVIRRENTTAIKARAVINMNMLEKETRGKRSTSVVRERALSSVAKALGETEGTVKDLYRLRTLIPAFWPLVDAKEGDKITNQYARNIAVLPADLQQYVFDEHLYDKKLSAPQMKMLKAAKTKDDIDTVYLLPQEFTVTSKSIIDEELPKEYKTVTLPFLPDEEATIKNIVLNSLGSANISDTTKRLLRKTFGITEN